VPDITHLLSDSQEELLNLVKRRGEVSVDEAVDSLELAETTIRQHFDRLEEAGLLTRESRAQGRGRPTVFFALSAAARQLYPSRDTEMLHALLDFLSREGYHREIDAFFREFWNEKRHALRERLEAIEPETFEEEMELLREFLDEQGFMPEIAIEEDGTVEIKEWNCPIQGSVQSTRLPCRLEAEFLEQVVGETLDRVEYIPDGHCACTYRFERGEDEE
jgi:predicted ArsR family transcriptional regulator